MRGIWHDVSMTTSSKRKRLLDAYRFIGFRPLEHLEGLFGDPKARLITLVRRSKKQRVASVVEFTGVGTTAAIGKYATFPVVAFESICGSRFGGCGVELAKR